MKTKSTRGLTKAGKRRGRPPKYLMPEQIEHPAPKAWLQGDGAAPPRLKSDTLFIIQMILAKHRAPLRSKEELAIRLDADDPRSDHSAAKVAAMAARIRRVSGDGIDKIPERRSRKSSISPKS